VGTAQHPNVVLPGLLKELWNYWLGFAIRLPARASTASFGWRGKCSAGSGQELFAGMLLGPEATRQGANPPGRFVSGVVFENCRVDASIFVVKLLRAHGGCLGFRSR
jgi:hypothetical protein